MKNLHNKHKFIVYILALVFFLQFSLFLDKEYLFAQVMQGSQYEIESDSINIGGVYSTSTNYSLVDTFGQVSSGLSSSTNYELNAGFLQDDSSSLAVVPPSDIVLSPSLPGMTGGTSDGSGVVSVSTDNFAGYSITINSSSNPSMTTTGASIADYVPSSGSADFDMDVPSGNSALGFTSEGVDIVQKFKDNGSICNTGSSDNTDACWTGLSTTLQSVSMSSSPNYPLSTDTTLKFRVKIGSGSVQKSGEYTATTTITILPN
ncbi:MAG: hypothetical protein Q7R78_03145 [bacterium]|nr:hypothetical protein [bacterium]